MILNDDSALDLAFELFMTLASDNLSEHEMALFNQYFNEYGFIELFDLEESTLDNLDTSMDFTSENDLDTEGNVSFSSSLAEVIIGANPPNSKHSVLFAKVILSLDSEKQFSHIQWMSDLN
ncbi:DUF440 family protein [Thorsellia kenyensis]|uniref:DUF440 family protein n=1 Tax=Thorsellia kenyensis TaxID=1549888 RepID=A0ABV6CCQ6_9GAMM